MNDQAQRTAAYLADLSFDWVKPAAPVDVDAIATALDGRAFTRAERRRVACFVGALATKLAPAQRR